MHETAVLADVAGPAHRGCFRSLIVVQPHVGGHRSVLAYPTQVDVALALLLTGCELHHHLLASGACYADDLGHKVARLSIALDGVAVVVIHGQHIVYGTFQRLSANCCGRNGEIHHAHGSLGGEAHEHVGDIGRGTVFWLLKHVEASILLCLRQIGQQCGMARVHIHLAEPAVHLLCLLIHLAGHHIEAVGAAVEGHALEHGVEVEVE